MMCKTVERLRCFFYLLLILGFYKTCYAAEPFDPSELDIVLAYMLLQHGAGPYFDEEIENEFIVSLHPQPIHLTLRIRYNEDNGVHSNHADEGHLPCQESCLISQNRLTILEENAASNNENILDTLYSIGSDSCDDLETEATSPIYSIQEDNERLQQNIWTNETHAEHEISVCVRQIDAEQSIRVSRLASNGVDEESAISNEHLDTLYSRGSDTVNNLKEEATSPIHCIQEDNERLQQNIWTNETHTEHEISVCVGQRDTEQTILGTILAHGGVDEEHAISNEQLGITNIRNRARVSFEEQLCDIDNTQKEREFAQADFLTNDISFASEISDKGMNTYEDSGGGITDKGMNTYEDSGGGNIKDSGDRDIHESTLADEGEDELARANWPEEKVDESQDNFNDQRITNTSLRQYRTLMTLPSVNLGEEMNLDNKPLDQENDPLMLEGQCQIDQKGLSKD